MLKSKGQMRSRQSKQASRPVNSSPNKYTQRQREVSTTPLKRWNFLGGAVRSGKTYLTYWLWLKEVRNSDGPFLLTGKTLGTLKRNVLDPMRDLFGSEIVGEVRSNSTIEIAGKRHYIICANDESSVERLQGSSYARAYGDEITTWPESFFKMLQSRLDKPGARFIGTYNPEGPYHWLKTSFIDRADTLNANVFSFHLDDNTFLDPDFVAALKTEYTGVWYDRYILGLWTAAEGLIYDMLEDRHIFTSLPPNVRLLREWVAVDYGTQNAFVALIIAQCSDGIYRVMSEYRWDGRESRQQKTDSQYADELDAFISTYGRIPQSIIVDPSAASFITELKTPNTSRKHHINVKPALNPVLDGIRRVASLIATDRLSIHQSCEGLINEMRSYAWDNETGKRTGVDTPFKEHDHGPDALRYWAYTMTNASGIIVVS